MLQVSFSKQIDQFKLKTSFEADKGVLGILGPSGCGKSLSLKCITGLHTPDEGRVVLNGKTLFDSNQKINIPSRKRKVGYVFQNYALFPHLTVYKNIEYGVKHLDSKTRKKEVSEAIDKMQLGGYENSYPSRLSGGQQQRVALARTLITKPDLLMLDEPFSALDSHIKQLLEKELLHMLRNNYQGIVLFVTHNIEEAYRLCDRILIYDKGRTLQIGDKEKIVRSPSSITAARITGCKNFIDGEVLGEENGYYIVKARELILKVKKTVEVNKGKVTIGIRSNDLKISSGLCDKSNRFECEVIEKIEGLFSTTAMVKCCGHLFRVEVSKHSCPHLAENNTNKLKLYMPEDRILLLTN